MYDGTLKASLAIIFLTRGTFVVSFLKKKKNNRNRDKKVGRPKYRNVYNVLYRIV